MNKRCLLKRKVGIYFSPFVLRSKLQIYDHMWLLGVVVHLLMTYWDDSISIAYTVHNISTSSNKQKIIICYPVAKELTSSVLTINSNLLRKQLANREKQMQYTSIISKTKTQTHTHIIWKITNMILDVARIVTVFYIFKNKSRPFL